jgi:2-aminoadipate transaminase
MLMALEREMAGLDVQWTRPVGGMFLWVKLPAGMDAQALLAKAVERNMAFVPGAPFYAGDAQNNTLRLSYVTVSAEQINIGIKSLAEAIKASL